MKRRHGIKWLVVIGVLPFLAACLKPKFIVPDFEARKPHFVAIAPFENLTNDIQIPNILRRLLAQRLPSRGFVVQPIEETNRILREEFEITLGEQLKLVELERLAKALKVDGIFMGLVEKAQTVVTGIYNRKAVKATVYLIDARTGDKLWEDEREAGETTIALKPADMLKAAAAEIAESAVSQAITGHPLYKYCVQIINTMVSTIPY